MLPAVDQPRRCNKMTGRLSPTIFPALSLPRGVRQPGALVTYKPLEQKSRLIPRPHREEAFFFFSFFSERVTHTRGTTQISPLASAAKFPREAAHGREGWLFASEIIFLGAYVRDLHACRLFFVRLSSPFSALRSHSIFVSYCVCLLASTLVTFVVYPCIN